MRQSSEPARKLTPTKKPLPTNYQPSSSLKNSSQIPQQLHHHHHHHRRHQPFSYPNCPSHIPQFGSHSTAVSNTNPIPDVVLWLPGLASVKEVSKFDEVYTTPLIIPPRSQGARAYIKSQRNMEHGPGKVVKFYNPTFLGGLWQASDSLGGQPILILPLSGLASQAGNMDDDCSLIDPQLLAPYPSSAHSIIGHMMSNSLTGVSQAGYHEQSGNTTGLGIFTGDFTDMTCDNHPFLDNQEISAQVETSPEFSSMSTDELLAFESPMDWKEVATNTK